MQTFPLDDSPSIYQLQTPATNPLSPTVRSATDLLLPPQRIADRLSHFPEDVYNLSPESHLVRFLSTLLGDAGAGQLRKRLLYSRLQQTFAGTHFFDLDRFYGALFGVQRRSDELLDIDPYIEEADLEEWRVQHAKDSSYRSRIVQFSRAISWGATRIGMELIAEALLGMDVDVYESWVTADQDGFGPRNEFTVRPKAHITPEENYDLGRVLRRLSPAEARFSILSSPEEVLLPVTSRETSSSSHYWEIRSQVTASAEVASAYLRLPDTPTEQPRPPFSSYQGEAWSYNADIVNVATLAEIVPGVWDEGKPTETPAHHVDQAIQPHTKVLRGRYGSGGILLSRIRQRQRVRRR
jgi:hypothetical protein